MREQAEKLNTGMPESPPAPVLPRGNPVAVTGLAGLIDAKDHPANRLFWAFLTTRFKRLRQPDQRDLAPICGFVPMGGAPKGIETARFAIGIESQLLNHAHPSRFEPMGDIALKIKLPVPFPSPREKAFVFRISGTETGRESLVHFVAWLGDARPHRGNNGRALRP